MSSVTYTHCAILDKNEQTQYHFKNFKSLLTPKTYRFFLSTWGRDGGLVDRAADSSLYDPSSIPLGEVFFINLTHLSKPL